MVPPSTLNTCAFKNLQTESFLPISEICCFGFFIVLLLLVAQSCFNLMALDSIENIWKEVAKELLLRRYGHSKYLVFTAARLTHVYEI